jgi:hypothetical protein
MLFFFAITRIVYNIKTFHAANEMCNLVSTRVKHISLHPSFLTPESGLHVLNVLMGSLAFVESFVSEVPQKDFNMTVSLPMLANP